MTSSELTHRDSNNICGLSNKTLGAICVVLGSLFHTVAAVLLDVGEESGISTNTAFITAASANLAGALVVDAIFYFVGYNKGKVHVCLVSFCLH